MTRMDRDTAFDEWIEGLSEHDFAFHATKGALKEAWNACLVWHLSSVCLKSSGQVSPTSANTSEQAESRCRLQERGISPDSILSPEEAAERSTSERLAALIQFQPKKEAV